MRKQRRGGLSGKARKARNRRRAARLHSGQLIDELVEPHAADQRCVPIRGRSDFLPSVAQVTNVKESDRQLEFALRQAEPSAATAKHGWLRRGKTKQEADSTADRAIRFCHGKAFDPRGLRPAVGTRLPLGGGFTVRGFLTGCAMGSAAAALLLVVVHTATR